MYAPAVMNGGPRGSTDFECCVVEAVDRETVLSRSQDAMTAGAAVPAKTTGVYIGCVWQEYQLLLEQLRVPSSIPILTGSGLNFLIGRVSYTFGFQGVSVPLESTIRPSIGTDEPSCMSGSALQAT